MRYYMANELWAIFRGKPLWLIAALIANLHAFDHSHGTWQKVLSAGVNEKGLVAYGHLRENSQHLRDYLGELSRVRETDFQGWAREEKMAFWINAYNALTINLMVENYPLKSIKNLWWPWKRKVFKMGRQRLSLDNIEHDILRKEFPDPRIHAVLVCASLSCPGLNQKAYTPSNLDSEMERMVKFWLLDSAKNVFDTQAGVVKISKIFSWYKDDFAPVGGVRKFLKKYISPQQAALLDKVPWKYLDYHWGLNEWVIEPRLDNHLPASE